MATTDDTVATETTEKKTAVKATPTPTPAGQVPRSFLVAFLLTMIAGPLGLRHFYLGDKKLGWIRTGLFAGGYVWIILMSLLGQGVLAFLGFIAVAVAGIWSLVDFFYVYNAVKTDVDGQALTATDRDRKWARMFYLAAIIGFVACLVLGIVAGAYIEHQIKNGDWIPRKNQNFDPYNTQEPTFEEYMRQLQEQSDSTTQSY